MFVNVANGANLNAELRHLPKVKREAKTSNKNDFNEDGFVDAPKKMMDLMMKMMSFDMMMKPIMEMMQKGISNDGSDQQQQDEIPYSLTHPYGAQGYIGRSMRPVYGPMGIQPALSSHVYPSSMYPYISPELSASTHWPYGHTSPSQQLTFGPYPQNNNHNELNYGVNEGANDDNNGMANILSWLPKMMMDLTLMPKMLDMIRNVIPSTSGKYSFRNK